MKVTSRKSITFPSLKWGINKGEVRELPEDKKAQEAILAHSAISEAEKKTTPKVEGEEKKVKTNN